MKNQNFSTEQQILTHINQIHQTGKQLLDEVAARCEHQNGTSNIRAQMDSVQRQIGANR